ncbi:hypothetical protein BGV57_03085 [Burkholderia ubonensis]|uniref:hypothetical protein n=1 Tax=Burkholderia ubonensis TaxID=101571 RepID=UPI0008FE42D5|nr:hypothetical protein [Burkholderia ubonensis]OJB45872.1 hypothetical protein BGV57_03085 [Burkholderia ubonensis]
MPKYIVTVEDTVRLTTTVEAANEEDAKKDALRTLETFGDEDFGYDVIDRNVFMCLEKADG